MNFFASKQTKNSRLGTKICPLYHECVRSRYWGKILRCCFHFLLQEVYFNTMQCPHSESLVYTTTWKGKETFGKIYTRCVFYKPFFFRPLLYHFGSGKKRFMSCIQLERFIIIKGVWQALFLCNICVFFYASFVISRFAFYPRLDKCHRRSQIFPVSFADFDIAKVLVSFSAFIF